jgi:sugar phosphate isomerase/epimerase
MAESLAKSCGLQLYAVGSELTKDLPGTLAKVAAIGYKVVESAGFAGKTAPEFRKALDAAGLKCPSSHLFPGPGPNPQQYFEDIKVVGSDYVVSSLLFKYMKPASVQTQDDFKRMASELNTLAIQARSVGLKFAYHNHNIEFRKWEDGRTTYEILMSETDPSIVKCEIDCGWADLAGHSPLSLFEQYAGRVRMLHIKDFMPVSEPVFALGGGKGLEWTELGKGHMDYRTILAAAPAAGVEHCFVEQDAILEIHGSGSG